MNISLQTLVESSVTSDEGKIIDIYIMCLTELETDLLDNKISWHAVEDIYFISKRLLEFRGETTTPWMDDNLIMLSLAPQVRKELEPLSALLREIHLDLVAGDATTITKVMQVREKLIEINEL